MELQRKVRRGSTISNKQASKAMLTKVVNDTSTWVRNSFIENSNANPIAVIIEKQSEPVCIENEDHNVNCDELLDFFDMSFSNIEVSDVIVEDTPQLAPAGSPVFNESFTMPNPNPKDEEHTQEWADCEIKENVVPRVVADSTMLTSAKMNSDIIHAANVDCKARTTLAPVAANPTSALSALDKMKLLLQRNAAYSTLATSSMQALKDEQMEQALKDASQIRKQATTVEGESNEEHNPDLFYGLPTRVKELLATHKGITDLYGWQDECLRLRAVQERRNLIYSLPTSGGKTLVAELLMLRELLCHERDVLFVLPYVAIVQEKVRSLTPFGLDLGFLVEEYAGARGRLPPTKRRSHHTVYVATIEKANSILNSLVEQQRIGEIGLIVVDELHMVGEAGGRGALLEALLTKAQLATAHTQIIAMSATLSNIGDLQVFLNAEVYVGNFRPVTLREYVKVEDTLHEVNLKTDEKLTFSRVLQFERVRYDSAAIKLDPDQLAGLVSEVVPHNSCLVFCPSKKNCENVADLLCTLLPKELLTVRNEEKVQLLRVLRSDGQGVVCPVLRRTLPYGVAYHHSGLTGDERRVLEEAYSDGVLCVLTCTSTLAAGVNLPAKRVILRSPHVGNTFLTCAQYRQMIGRAGRAGLDTSGESIVIVKPRERGAVRELVCGPLEQCISRLTEGGATAFKSLLVSAIGLKLVVSVQSAVDLVSRSLCHVQQKQLGLDLVSMTYQCLRDLQDAGFVRQLAASDCFSQPVLEVTRLGCAVFKGGVDVDRGQQLYGDLDLTRLSLVVSNHLHLLYIVTPYDLVEQIVPQWSIYLSELGRLTESEQQVARLVGVDEAYIVKMVAGKKVRKQADEFVIRRFYLTLVLYSLWRQATIWETATRFQLPRGFVQQLLNSAAAFGVCVLHFCQELEEFWAYRDLLPAFVQRLSYCVTAELLPLMEIPGVKLGRAKQLFAAGYKTLQLVAYCQPDKLVADIEHLSRKAARQIITSAQMLLQEKATALQEEVQELVAVPTAAATPVTVATTAAAADA